MEISATISSFLTHVKVDKGLSSNTISAYRIGGNICPCGAA